jgi:hypothetical protein
MMTLCPIVGLVVFTLFSIVLSPWLTGIFYPTLVDSARPYIFIANLAAIVSVSTGLIRPAVLKFAPTSWQLPISIVYGIIYFGFGYIALTQWGLMGFCYAILVANVLNFVILYLAGEKALHDK